MVNNIPVSQIFLKRRMNQLSDREFKMAKYIEREAAEKVASKYGCGNGSTLGRHSGIADCIADEISKIPAIDVAPVRHGRWILVDKSYGEYECSVCHARDSNCSDYYGVHDVTEQDWCPYCGAFMKLKDEAE